MRNMQEQSYAVTVGGLLHDVGKILYRSGDGRSHPESGYDFLKNEAGITDEEILRQVRYHHSKALRSACIPRDSLAYITYIADNIASAADRRDSEQTEGGFSRETPLESIFNLLNGNRGNLKYRPRLLDEREEINYPTDDAVQYTEAFHNKLKNRLLNTLLALEPTDAYVNSLLTALEAVMSYVPSSTNKKEVADISLYDHSKLTAAVGNCILLYLQERNVSDFRSALYVHAQEFYSQKAFLLYSIDISGIQDFIYTIADDGALKSLRARSFYLELLMEHLVDTILDRAGVSRANCLYCGGGHAYLLLANTAATRQAVDCFERETNEWFLHTFGTELYLAGGYTECSTDNLKNEPAGSYKQLFKNIALEISRRKLCRYTPAQILALNRRAAREDMRECSVCRRTDRLTEENICSVCEGIKNFSARIQEDKFFVVTRTPGQECLLPLPGDCFLTSERDEEQLRGRIIADGGYVRSYCKNSTYTGKEFATRLWVGDYRNGDSFEELAQSSGGIPRLAVLRADVDNLGKAFVSGFESESFGQRYVTLSRTATFSRSLSLFFKLHINQLLTRGKYSLRENAAEQETLARRATVVYSGGDDVFIIGAWDDIIGFAVDLHNALEKYSEGTLSISAGIGLYPEKYPVAGMARQTGELEERSKAQPDKNAVTLFDENGTYRWNDFIHSVLEEKFVVIRDFFNTMEQYGKSFLYQLLDLMRNRGEKINLARYAYLLARMEPPPSADDATKGKYREFSRRMYGWMRDREQCRQAITAVYIYVYTIREGQKHGI